MMNKFYEITDKLIKSGSLDLEEYEFLVEAFSPEALEYTSKKALETRRSVYGDDIYIRGLIEISNICKNDCLYCGIRASNKLCDRYRLNKEDIVACCKEGYKLGFRTFVLQGGEDLYYEDDVLCDIIKNIKALYPDCALTLSLGERSEESYRQLFSAGADRYLLRHETASKEHYEKLHPQNMSFENRMKCLGILKEIGYQVGCGFMVGSPYQDTKTIAMDLKFIEEFKPQMCGIGPFIPHKDTEFANEKAGSGELTCYLLSIVRLILPNVLLPATTALATVSKDGRNKGILCGANVVMPNLSPSGLREKYSLYDNKASFGLEACEGLDILKKDISELGAKIICARGDAKDI